MIENIIMSSHAPQIDINGLTVVYRFLALLIKWWCSGTGNRTPTIQTTGRRLSTHGHPSGPEQKILVAAPAVMTPKKGSCYS